MEMQRKKQETLHGQIHSHYRAFRPRFVFIAVLVKRFTRLVRF